MPSITLKDLKTIDLQDGKLQHIIKKSDDTFSGFGEAYFSWIMPNKTKGWKLHKKMTMNIVVPVGQVLFQFKNDSDLINFSVEIGEENYQLLTVPPLNWFCFTGVSKYPSLVLNVANIEHDPGESIHRKINSGK